MFSYQLCTIYFGTKVQPGVKPSHVLDRGWKTTFIEYIGHVKIALEIDIIGSLNSKDGTCPLNPHHQLRVYITQVRARNTIDPSN